MTPVMPVAVEFKTVVYRGGVVRFRIPAYWIEEYEHDGGGTFYEEGPDTATLRLNVLSFEGTRPGDTPSAFEFLSNHGRSEQPDAEVVRHADGNASISYWKLHEEDADEPALAIRYWQVANRVPPRYMRMAVFSYTIQRAQMNQPRFVDEVRMIDDEVRQCRFSEQLGVVPSSDPSESET